MGITYKHVTTRAYVLNICIRGKCTRYNITGSSKCVSDTMITLRPDQRETVDKALYILRNRFVVYMACEVRVGKTIMSLTVAKEMGWKKVCLITKLNAIPSIRSDYDKMGKPFQVLTVVNFEQAGKQLANLYDGFIIDEAHSLSAFAKPSKRARIIRELIGFRPCILMSGTPSPESLSQLYHQFWVTQYGPWVEFPNFYKWAKKFVDVKQKKIGSYFINDYSRAKENEVNASIAPYMVRLSQQDAGFTSFVDEEILWVDIDSRIYKVLDKIKKDKVYTMKSGDVILADTPVRMQSVFHQLSSGTIKTGEKRQVIDESKAWFIKSKFAGQKIAIFYKFIAEGELLRRIFPEWTDSQDIFNKSQHRIFLKQCVSGREGANLSTADCLIAYNIDFSATTYWQMRARMQSRDRTKVSKLYWIFSKNGIERFIHRAVTKKHNFTTQYFRKAIKDWNARSTTEIPFGQHT